MNKFSKDFDFLVSEIFNSILTPIEQEEKGDVKLTLETPGVKRENLSIKIEGNNLLIESKEPNKEFKKSYKVDNSKYNLKNCSSTYKDGLLVINIPSRFEPSENFEVKID